MVSVCVLLYIIGALYAAALVDKYINRYGSSEAKRLQNHSETGHPLLVFAVLSWLAVIGLHVALRYRQKRCC